MASTAQRVLTEDWEGSIKTCRNAWIRPSLPEVLQCVPVFGRTSYIETRWGGSYLQITASWSLKSLTSTSGVNLHPCWCSSGFCSLSLLVFTLCYVILCPLLSTEMLRWKSRNSWTCYKRSFLILRQGDSCRAPTKGLLRRGRRQREGVEETRVHTLETDLAHARERSVKGKREGRGNELMNEWITFPYLLTDVRLWTEWMNE